MAGHKNADTSPAQIAKCLGGIHFPCSKDDLVHQAQANGCSTEAFKVIEQIPDKSYRTMADVMSGVGKVE